MTYDIVLSREELYQGRGDFAAAPPGTRKGTVYIKVAFACSRIGHYLLVFFLLGGADIGPLENNTVVLVVMTDWRERQPSKSLAAQAR